MTNKVYKSAMGKEVDLGALLLQNEHVRAVGNMGVNARGDKLDSTNKVIDTKNRQIQRQYKKTTNVSSTAVQSSTIAAKQQNLKTRNNVSESESTTVDSSPMHELVSEPVIDPVVEPAPVATMEIPPTGEGGLAAAIARSRLIKQEKEKTLKEKAREQGIRKI